MPPPRRRDHCRRLRGAPDAQEGRSGLSAQGGGLLPVGGRDRRVGSLGGGLLRQAAAQVRAHPRDVSRCRAARVPLVPARRPAVDQGQALHRQAAEGRAGISRRDPLLRASRIARRERVLSVALRGGRNSHDGRRGRVGHCVDRQSDGATTSRSSTSCTGPIRSACCTPRSPTTPASRSTPESTR